MAGADRGLEDALEPEPLQTGPDGARQFRERVVRVGDGLAELLELRRGQEVFELGPRFLESGVTFADFLRPEVDDGREVGVAPADVAREDGLFGVGGEAPFSRERL
jgi:hypothetical protein